MQAKEQIRLQLRSPLRDRDFFEEMWRGAVNQLGTWSLSTQRQKRSLESVCARELKYS